ncbi:MAG: DUF4184 family protein [Steroidobacteraceae bacterium]
MTGVAEAVPFTVSHVAAVLPGYRRLSRAHVFSAAVIGSMVPDFGFLLLPVSLARWQTHSAVALFTFCLPVGLCAYWLLQLLIKPALLEVLPDRAYVRLRAAHPSQRLSSTSGWLYAAIAVLLGAVTHLIWDGFTHENAHGVRMFPLLDEYGPEIDGHPMQFYNWLQYGSSVIGLMLVAMALALWWQHSPSPSQPPMRALGRSERRFWSGLYILVPLAMAALPLLRIHMSLVSHLIHVSPVRHLSTGFLRDKIAIALMRGCALSLLLVSALVRTRLPGRRAPPD